MKKKNPRKIAYAQLLLLQGESIESVRQNLKKTFGSSMSPNSLLEMKKKINNSVEKIKDLDDRKQDTEDRKQNIDDRLKVDRMSKYNSNFLSNLTRQLINLNRQLIETIQTQTNNIKKLMKYQIITNNYILKTKKKNPSNQKKKKSNRDPKFNTKIKEFEEEMDFILDHQIMKGNEKFDLDDLKFEDEKINIANNENNIYKSNQFENNLQDSNKAQLEQRSLIKNIPDDPQVLDFFEHIRAQIMTFIIHNTKPSSFEELKNHIPHLPQFIKISLDNLMEMKIIKEITEDGQEKYIINE